MGVRISNTYYSLSGELYKVEIYDSDFAGSVTNYGCTPAVITWDDESDNFLEPIKSSSCSIVFHDDGSGTFDAFRSDLVSAQENEFQLVLSKWNGSSYDLYWCGVIMSDMVQVRNESAPRDLEIIAKDGLNRIKTILFDNIEASPFDSEAQTFMYIIEKCLAKNGLASFHTGDYIKVSVDWYDTQMSTSQKQRVFERMRIWGEMFRKDIDDTESKKTDVDPMYVWEVLASMLKLFGARIIYSEGAYHIQQISNFVSSTYDVANYDSSGTYDSIDTSVSNVVAEDGVNLEQKSGGVFGWHAAYKRTKLTARGYLDVRGAYIEEMTVNRSDTSETTTLQLGTIIGGTGRDIEIDFDLSNYTTSQVLGTNIYAIVDIKLICGSYRIKNRAGYANQEVSDWTTTLTDKWSYRIDGHDLTYKKARVVAKNIPFASEANCTCEVTITIYKKDGASWTGGGLFPTTNSEFFSEIRNVRVIVWDANIDTLGDIEVICDNPTNTENSVEFDFGKIIIGDNPLVQRSISSRNSFEILDSTSAWKRPNVWEAGFDTDVNLVSTMLLESMALRKSPTKKYMGGFIGSYAAHKALSYDSTTWVVNRLEYDTGMDEWDGTWFAVAYSQSSIQQDTERYKPGKETFGLPPYRIQNLPLKNDNPVPINPKGKGAVPYEQGSTMTYIGTELLDNNHLKEGDSLLVYHPTTRELLHTFEVDTDTSVSDTSIAVVSDTNDADIPVGCLIEHNSKEVVHSAMVRADKMVSLGAQYIDVYTDTTDGNYQITVDQYVVLVDNDGGGLYNIYLPEIADCSQNGKRQVFIIKRIAGVGIIKPHTSDSAQIHHGGSLVASITMSGGAAYMITHDGTNWISLQIS